MIEVLQTNCVDIHGIHFVQTEACFREALKQHSIFVIIIIITPLIIFTIACLFLELQPDCRKKEVHFNIIQKLNDLHYK